MCIYKDICLHMYIHTYVHTPTYVYIYIHINIYVYMHLQIHKHIHTHVCIYTYLHIYVDTYIHICTYVHIYRYTHIYTHIYTYTYIHIYICTHDTSTYLHTYIYTSVHLYKCTYVHMYICRYVYLCICICTFIVYAYIHTLDIYAILPLCIQYLTVFRCIHLLIEITLCLVFFMLHSVSCLRYVTKLAVSSETPEVTGGSCWALSCAKIGRQDTTGYNRNQYCSIFIKAFHCGSKSTILFNCKLNASQEFACWVLKYKCNMVQTTTRTMHLCMSTIFLLPEQPAPHEDKWKWLKVHVQSCWELQCLLYESAFLRSPKETRRRMARERRGAGSSLVSMETPYYKTIY